MLNKLHDIFITLFSVIIIVMEICLVALVMFMTYYFFKQEVIIMYVKDKFIKRELNRIDHTFQADEEQLNTMKTKVELMHDLEIINEEQYSYYQDKLRYLQSR